MNPFKKVNAEIFGSVKSTLEEIYVDKKLIIRVVGISLSVVVATTTSVIGTILTVNTFEAFPGVLIMIASWGLGVLVSLYGFRVTKEFERGVEN